MKFSDANSIQRHFYQALLSTGINSSPRRLKTRELLNQGFELTNPRNRLTTLSGRGWSKRLAVGELAWHLRGDRSAEALAFYVPRWMEFADPDGIIRGSCYGWRIFGSQSHGKSQWDWIVETLTVDKQSRRAVLNFQGPDFQRRAPEAADVSCAITQQFLIRDGKLHSLLNMRSNDVFWGLPYDLFVFTSLHELLAIELGCELGSYFHQCASLHIYEDMVERVERILTKEQPRSPVEMLPMAQIGGVEYLIEAERSYRKSRSFIFDDLYSNTFWGDCVNVFQDK